MVGKLSLTTSMLFCLHVCKALRPMWSPASRAINLRSNVFIRECSLPRNYAKGTGLFLSKKRNDSNRPKCRMLNADVSEFDISKFPRPLKGVLFDMDVSFERLYFVKLDDARNINNICREHCLTLSPCTGEHMPMYLCGKCRRFPPILFLGNITTRIWAVEQRRVKNRLDSTRATDTLQGRLTPWRRCFLKPDQSSERVWLPCWNRFHTAAVFPPCACARALMRRKESTRAQVPARARARAVLRVCARSQEFEVLARTDLVCLPGVVEVPAASPPSPILPPPFSLRCPLSLRRFPSFAHCRPVGPAAVSRAQRRQYALPTPPR